MRMTFRWFGKNDPVTLENIRQIPVVRGIVSALYDVPAGVAWEPGEVRRLKDTILRAGLEFSVVESLPVSEEIKLGLPVRDEHIANYIKSLDILGREGVEVVCYNFMPVLDWTRTDLRRPAGDGSTSLGYAPGDMEKIDPRQGFSLPGWAAAAPGEIRQKIEAWEGADGETLWRNLEYFLKAVLPEAERGGVKLAIHPDDPPWPIFGLPRIITSEAALDRLLALVDNPFNGLTFCTGSLGPGEGIDSAKLLRKYSAAGRLHFVHLRNIRKTSDGGFRETAHPTECGDVDMYEAVKALVDTGYTGPVRPDHGRMIWGETGKPGYGLYDRALGAMYLAGLWEGLS